MAEKKTTVEEKKSSSEHSSKSGKTALSESELQDVVDKLRQGVEIKDRKWLLSTYEKSFVGTEAVDWLVLNEYASSREEAVRLGNNLIAANIFKHVTRDHQFKDESLFYRFIEDEPSRGAKEKKHETNEAWSWGDLIPSRFQREDKLVLQPDLPSQSTDVHEAKLDEGDTFGVWPIDKHNQELLDNVHPVKWIPPEPQTKYNLVAIGAGAGGLVTAASAGAMGGKAAIIEERLFGGDCLNAGCVPSKALLRAAKVAHTAIHRGAEFGLKIEGKISVDFGRVMERMREIRAKISHHDSCQRFTTEYDLDVFLGHAEFISANEVKVGDKVLSFRRCVIATGASPSVPPIAGLDDIAYLTNHSLWNLTEQPKRFGVLGSGPIGCEMAQAFAMLGSDVTVLNRSPRILGKEDLEAAQLVEQSMRDCGISFHTGLDFKKIGYVDADVGKSSGIKVEFVVKATKEATSIVVDELLIATGRVPNLNLGLEKANVKYNKRGGVEVNDYLQTSNPDIYAVGDCCSKYQFTHMSDAMAKIVVRNALFFGRNKVSNLIVPWATFTSPEVAHVGLYESDCNARKMDFDVYKVGLEGNDRAICEGDNIGFIKVICKKGSDEILGCTIVSENAGDQISEMTLAIQSNTGLGFLGDVIHPYPTVAEVIKASGNEYNKTRLTPLNRALLRKILQARR